MTTSSPLNAWLILQGVETLHLRMQAHCRNALRVAQFLSDHPLVSWVNYPGLPQSPHYALAKACEFLSHLANIGDAKTLVIHPASTTHRQLDEAELLRAGVRPDMIRLSVGIEEVDDILWDIDQALRQAVA